MSKISELSDGGVIQGGDTLIAVRSGGNVKVTYGGSTTANIDGGTIDGTTIGGTTPAAGNFTTGSFTGNVSFGDNDKAIFGAGSDLQIYHDGSNSYIQDSGTGNLRIAGTLLQLNDASFNKYLQGSGDAVTLYNADSPKLATTSTGIDVTGVITTDGMTTSADINFGDNDKAVFGAGSDLQIYHTGSVSLIKDAGTGGLYLGGSNLISLGSSDFTETYALFNDDGAVSLRYDNATKLATTSTGIDVTGSLNATGIIEASDGTNGEIQLGLGTALTTGAGTYDSSVRWNGSSGNLLFSQGAVEKMRITGSGIDVTGSISADALTVDGTGDLGTIGNGAFNAAAALGFQSDRAFFGYSSSQNALIQSGASKGVAIEVNSDTLDSGTRAALFASNGDISFYEDTGTTASLVYTAASTSLKLTGRETSRSNASYALEVDNSAQSSNMSTAGAFNVEGYYGNQLTVNGLGDVSFYDDSGTAKFFWDASAESLGIGTSSPNGRLNIQSSASGQYLLNLDYADGTDGGGFYEAGSTGLTLFIKDSSGNSDVQIASEGDSYFNGGNVGIGTDLPASQLHLASTSSRVTFEDTNSTNNSINAIDSYEGTMIFNVDVNNNSTVSESMRFTMLGDEAMRIDSSGNLLVGQTSADSNSVGIGLLSNGTAYAVRDGSAAILAHRKSSDGNIVEFLKDNSTVGSIGNFDANNMYIGSGDTGIAFQGTADRLLPIDASTGAVRNSAIDLGYSGGRFKDLYLSGGAYLGGTGSANKLDDYEEGDILASAIKIGGVAVSGLSGFSGVYTKVGSLVSIDIVVSDSSVTASTDGSLTIDLPFAKDNNGGGGVHPAVIYLGASSLNYPSEYYWAGNNNYTMHLLGSANLNDVESLTAANVSNMFFRLSFTYYTNT